MAFLATSDYDVQIRNEIAQIIDPTTERSKIKRAEDMAIAQMKNHLAGRYDIDAIFVDAPADGETDTRDAFMVMLAIDIALYHLWTKEGPNNIPKTRELRYNDALEWLKAVQKGEAANLPPIINEDGEETFDVRIWSEHERESNRF